MQRKNKPSIQSSCSGDPISQIDQIGDKLGINTTPTMVFADGGVIVGMVNAAQIEKYLADMP